jgi:hypothetical protein
MVHGRRAVAAQGCIRSSSVIPQWEHLLHIHAGLQLPYYQRLRLYSLLNKPPCNAQFLEQRSAVPQRPAATPMCPLNAKVFRDPPNQSSQKLEDNQNQGY